MGCIASKNTVSITPAFDYSGSLRAQGPGILPSAQNQAELEKKKCELEESGRGSSIGSDSLSLRLGNLQKYIEGEQVAAGWPSWLSAVAGEAIQGWVPLNADSFEKLEKIGQGTYSSVFRARDIDTGKIVALKKVRFDNFEPESVRFMAREILILRRLDHPNVVKLEGLITSRLSCSIYLVFEYMDHDLAGLSSCPDINFGESQVKCYMRQLLSGLEHCHSRGIMHRDIKGSNLLVNNEGILKMADFGLANFFNAGHRQPLTSRVVTLWYRPPELLLGSTDYGASVDLWSVGCVFAELLLGKPILQGRTEVEQLHKIFKLCGSPPDEYWRKSKWPHGTIFKPQQPYESCLGETCKGFPETALSLVETLLSIEPYKRGTASSALASEYFTTKPYACDPSTLPKYAPNKEIDAKSREEAHRKKAAGRVRNSVATRVPATRRPANGLGKLAAPTQEPHINAQEIRRSDSAKLNRPKQDDDGRSCVEPPKMAVNLPEVAFHAKQASQGDLTFTGPLHINASSGFAWAKKRKEGNASLRLHSRSSSRGLVSGALDASTIVIPRNISDSKRRANRDVLCGAHIDSKGHESFDISDSKRRANRDVLCVAHIDSKGHESFEFVKRAMLKQWTQVDHLDSFDASDVYHSQELLAALYQRDELSSKRNILGYQDEGDKIEFSGPLLSQSSKVDEILERNERHIRQAAHRPWFQRGRRQGK
ncbi:protein IMPAIRED IN BABA-INDUCED STERILITY 1-like [Tasmannia lanceolata]|uniref:protein IMPAIRED IN BABA-INDUCED STERILITY 1-like n=1 Tax=Tasmannia lanceolata TaxID=3420 RepID=UPI004062F31E